MKEKSKMLELRYFKDDEFKRAVPPCSLSDMDEEFMRKLDECRDFAGLPFVINSAYRSVAWEKKHGRQGTSQHCLGKAVDIRCRTNAERYRIIESFLVNGFKRIGVGSNFIHVDSGYPDSQPIIWTY